MWLWRRSAFRGVAGGGAERFGRAAQSASQPQVTSDDRVTWLVLSFAFLSGAGVLSLEILGLAMVNLKAPLAIYPQAAILICVIFLLAVSAAVVPRVVRRFNDTGQVLSICLATAGLTISLVPVVFMNLPGARMGIFGYGRGFADFLVRLAGVTIVSLGPAMMSAGTVFPLSRCVVRPGGRFTARSPTGQAASPDSSVI